MVISSRTPEGDPNCCPICGCRLRLEPTRPPGDAPCPQCGHLLWFAESGDPGVREVRRTDARTSFLDFVRMRFGPVPEELRESVEDLAEEAEQETEGRKLFIRALMATSLEELLAES
jgi:hypothetical protein